MTIDNAIERFRTRQRTDAIDRLEATFETAATEEGEESDLEPSMLSLEGPRGMHTHKPSDQTATMAPSLRAVVDSASKLAAKAEQILPKANDQDAADLRPCWAVCTPRSNGEPKTRSKTSVARLEDVVFYLEDRSELDEASMKVIAPDQVRCPTCRALQEWSDTCRRCRSDLSLLRAACSTHLDHRRNCILQLDAACPDLPSATPCAAMKSTPAPTPSASSPSAPWHGTNGKRHWS